ncbi:hypothetical protein [Photorhabdus sp. SF281]|uniref:hypothetical protein n=1 Tax=Photorhabdus sp. SF281 TaxID=3459527 RepID=UPI0040446828
MTEVLSYNSPITIKNETGKDILSVTIYFINNKYKSELKTNNVIPKDRKYVPLNNTKSLRLEFNGGSSWWLITWITAEKDEQGNYVSYEMYASDPGPYAGWLDTLNRTASDMTSPIASAATALMSGTLTAKAMAALAGFSVVSGVTISAAAFAAAATLITSFAINYITQNKDIEVSNYERHNMPHGSTNTFITIHDKKVEIKTVTPCTSLSSPQKDGKCYSTSEPSVKPIKKVA